MTTRRQPSGSGAARVALVAAALAGLTIGVRPAPATGLTLLPVNDAYSMAHDRTLVVPAPGVLGNDVGLLGQTAVLVSGTTHGSLTLRQDGGFTYVPNAGYVGTDSFVYRPSGLLTPSATVTITIKNTAPVAVDDSYTATTGVTLSVGAPGVMTNDDDADGDALTATKVTDSGSGSVNLSSNGSFTFTSGGSFTGLRTFTYRVSDGIAFSAVATVTIDVKAPSPTPAPTPSPTPAPTPTPRPTPTPLPTLPLPTLSILPTLPPLPTIIPGPTPTPLPTGSARPTPTPTGPEPSPSPTRSGEPTPRPTDGGGSPPPGSTGGSGSGGGTGGNGNVAVGGGSTGGAGEGGVAPGALNVTIHGPDPLISLVDVGFTSLDDLDWAVPALTLTVPGLLLIIAVIAQATAGAFWLPFVRRWLGGFGVAKRRRKPA